MKQIAAIVSFLICVILGANKSYSLKKRVSAIEDAISFFDRAEILIKFRALTIAKIIEEIAITENNLAKELKVLILGEGRVDGGFDYITKDSCTHNLDYNEQPKNKRKHIEFMFSTEKCKDEDEKYSHNNKYNENIVEKSKESINKRTINANKDIIVINKIDTNNLNYNEALEKSKFDNKQQYTHNNNYIEIKNNHNTNNNYYYEINTIKTTNFENDRVAYGCVNEKKEKNKITVEKLLIERKKLISEVVEKIKDIKKDEFEIIVSGVVNLGSTDSNGQAALIKSTKLLLSDILKQAREECDKKGTMYSKLGILLGAGIGIILI